MVTPKLRFREFDGDWHSIAIGNFLKIKSGLGFKAEEYTTEEEIRLLQIENVGYGAVKWTHNVKFVPSNYLELHKDLVLKEGDLVLALNRPVTNDQLKIAKLTKEDSPSILYQRVGKLDFLKEEFDREFIFQIFQKDVKSYVLNSSIGSDQPFISTTDLYKHKLCIPSKEEQTQIASFLSAVDKKISQLSQKHQLLSQYKQGMMQKLFSQQIRFKADDGSEFREWKIGKLGDITSIQGGFAFKSTNFGKGMTKVIRIGDIEKNINLDSFTGIYSNEIPDTRYLISENAIVMALSGATFGKLGKVNQGYAYINQRVATFKVFEDSLNEFVYQIMLSQEFTTYIQSIPSASAQPNISNQDVINFEMMIPCLEEQTKIANFLSAIDQKINVVSGQLEQAKLWKKGLLQQMFV